MPKILEYWRVHTPEALSKVETPALLMLFRAYCNAEHWADVEDKTRWQASFFAIWGEIARRIPIPKEKKPAPPEGDAG
jgi:hypothetical protein